MISFCCCRLPISVPTACVTGPYDIVSPDGMVEQVYPNMVHRIEHNYGHFYGYENPEFVAKDIYEAVEKMNRINYEKLFVEKSEL